MLPSPVSIFVLLYRSTEALVSSRHRTHCTVPRSLRAATWNLPWHPSARQARPLKEDLRVKTKKGAICLKRSRLPLPTRAARYCLSSQIRDDHLHTFPRLFSSLTLRPTKKKYPNPVTYHTDTTQPKTTSPSIVVDASSLLFSTTHLATADSVRRSGER